MDGFLAAARRVKPLSRCAHDPTSLKQCLTLVDLVAYGVGCSVGAGVYSLVGVGAQLAGPSISLSFFLSGVACVFTSLTYSEFAARVPVRAVKMVKRREGLTGETLTNGVSCACGCR